MRTNQMIYRLLWSSASGCAGLDARSGPGPADIHREPEGERTGAPPVQLEIADRDQTERRVEERQGGTGALRRQRQAAENADLPPASSGGAARRAPARHGIIHHEHVADAVNNGHPIQVNYSEDDTLAVGGSADQLASTTFTPQANIPSEERGSRWKCTSRTRARWATGRDRRSHRGGLAQRRLRSDPANLPSRKGIESHMEHVTVDVDALLPRARTTYRYDGSLTTPPCNEKE
jgi:hypothetical protein